MIVVLDLFYILPYRSYICLLSQQTWQWQMPQTRGQKRKAASGPTAPKCSIRLWVKHIKGKYLAADEAGRKQQFLDLVGELCHEKKTVGNLTGWWKKALRHCEHTMALLEDQQNLKRLSVQATLDVVEEKQKTLNYMTEANKWMTEAAEWEQKYKELENKGAGQVGFEALGETLRQEREDFQRLNQANNELLGSYNSLQESMRKMMDDRQRSLDSLSDTNRSADTRITALLESRGRAYERIDRLEADQEALGEELLRRNEQLGRAVADIELALRRLPSQSPGLSDIGVDIQEAIRRMPPYNI
eukprot:COSAG05_NODE_124_length_17559_cov_8.898643_15_plen_302_part_00